MELGREYLRLDRYRLAEVGWPVPAVSRLPPEGVVDEQRDLPDELALS